MEFNPRAIRSRNISTFRAHRRYSSLKHLAGKSSSLNCIHIGESLNCHINGLSCYPIGFLYREVQLAFNPEIEVFFMLFDRYHSKYRRRSNKQHSKYFCRCKTQLHHPVLPAHIDIFDEMSQFIILTSIPFQAPGAALHWSAGEGHCAAPGRAERVPLGGGQPAVAPAERATQGQLHQGAQQLSGKELSRCNIVFSSCSNILQTKIYGIRIKYIEGC